MKRSLKDFGGSSNSSSSGVCPSKKAYNVPKSEEIDREIRELNYQDG